MNPRDFHELASELVGSSNTAKIRTAINRAYYAAYNTGVEILNDMGFYPRTGPSGHKDVQYHLNNSGDDEIISACVKMDGLFSKRIRADYKLDKKDVDNPKTATALVKDAGSIIKTLDISTSKHGGKRQEIINSIKKWKEKI